MMTNEEYHSAEGISKSMLDKIHISPLAYWDAYINPDREPQEETKSMLIGSATHALILEPDVFKQKYAVGFDKYRYPEALDTMADLKDELKNIGCPISGSKQELIERLVDENLCYEKQILDCLETTYVRELNGRTIISAQDYKNILGMLTSINGHHTATKLIAGATVEQSFFVTDEYGMTRKCRPDVITRKGKVVCDLKTTTDVGQIYFPMSCYKYRYHVQAAWYLDTLKLVMGEDAPDTFCFIAVQKQRPYDVAVYVLPNEVIELGRAEYQKDYELLRRCMETNNWPGADGGNLLGIALPKWAGSAIME